jgi:hypothetical protein
MEKTTSKRRKWLSSVPIGLALVLSIIFGYVEAYRAMHNSEYFSADSLQSLRSLNFQYDMMVDDLSAPDDSSLMTDLFKANVLISTKDVERASRGLVVSLEDGYLLLEPVNELSDVELGTIAGVYEESIPEFEVVEVDQDVELFDSPIFWKNWDELEVELTSESIDLEDEPLKPISVAVVDSGVDVEHEIFTGHEVSTGWNTVDGDTNMYDDVGHGTHIAGIIASEMAGAVIAPYKIVGAQGGRLSNVIEAFEKAIDDDVDIINTSFGLMSPSHSLGRLVNEAFEEGIIMISAAGNEDSSIGFYPASYDNTIAVASLYPNNKKMDASNYGDWIDVATLGYRVRSSVPGDSYGYKSGTSQATAFISAEVARILTINGLENEMSFEEVLEALLEERELVEEGELEGVAIIE